ncbi:MAG TPA: twin-arginine translocation signal domain-containing protein [Gammaproteobacteria bacterium]
MNEKPLHRAVAEACAALTRREFIGGAAAAVGAATLPFGAPVRGAAVPQAATHAADWTIDDQWTGYPRPTERLIARPRAPTLLAVAPEDRGFVA